MADAADNEGLGRARFPNRSNVWTPASSHAASARTEAHGHQSFTPFGGHEGTAIPAAQRQQGNPRGRGAPMRGRGRGSSSSTRGKSSFGNRSAVFGAPKEASATSSEGEGGEGTESEMQNKDEEIGEHDTGSTFGAGNTTIQDRERRFENLPKQNRFFELRAQREALRAQYIKQGVLPDPDKPTDLTQAKALTGRCMEMCPEFEREEREFQNEGDSLEMFPGTTRIDPAIAVKIYRRPAAGRELPLPEDVRPPNVLRQTLDYLVHDLLPTDPSSSTFTTVQPFMWNRTRAIRQDFIVQGERGAMAIECHERIARYHILCLHWRGGAGAEGWSEQQELEQLRKTIRSLTEFYEDMRFSGRSSPNEGEFRAYNLLLHIHDPETLREVEALPTEVFDSETVQIALKLRAYAQRSNNVVRRGRPRNTEATMNLWTRFFGELRRKDSRVTYLLACLAENVFSAIRAGALKAMGKTYLSQHAPLPLSFLQESLGLDSEEQARSFAVELGAEEVFAADGKLLGVRLSKVNDEKPLPLAPFSRSIVESKRGSFTCQDVIDGKASQSAPLHDIGVRARGRVAAAALPAQKSLAFSREPAEQEPSSTFKPSTASALSAQASTFVPASPAHPVTFKASEKPQGLSAFPKKPEIGDTSAPTFSPTSAPSKPPSLPSFVAPFGVSSQNSTSDLTTAATSPLSLFQPAEKSNASTFLLPDDLSHPRHQATSDPKVLPSASRATSATSFKAATPPLPAPVQETYKDPATARLDTAPVKPTEPIDRPKRTLKSVTEALYMFLEREFVQRKVESVSGQACLREQRIRRSDARKLTIERCVEELTQEMLDDFLDESLGVCCSESIATEKHTRSINRHVWSKWTRALAKVRQQAQQTARLHHIRAQLKTKRSPSKKNGERSTYLLSSATHLQALDDELLQESLLRAREDRSDVWMPSTFLWAIATFVQDLLLPGIENWTVALALPKDAASSQWLRVKFSLENEPHAEIAVRSDACVHAVDVTACASDDLVQERDLGMLVFELDPQLAHLPAKQSLWHGEKERLASFARSAFVTQSRFLPKLMIVAWTDEQTIEGHDIEWARKRIFKMLGLTATEFTRHCWSQIDVWLAGRTAVSAQQSFEAQLRSIFRSPLEWNTDRQAITFDDVLYACSSHWRAMVERVDKCMSRLSQAPLNVLSTNDGTAVDFLVSTFNTVTFLCERVLDDILAVSEVVHDENINDENAHLPLVDSAHCSLRADAKSWSQATLELAEYQVQRMLAYESTSDDVLLLRSWLSEHRSRLDVGQTFSWCAYFDRVLQIGLARVQQTWIEATLSSMSEIEEQVKPSTDLHAQAARELEWKTQKILRQVVLQPLPGLTNGKRRIDVERTDDNERNGHSDVNGKHTIIDGPASKIRKVDEHNDAISLTPSHVAAPKAISSLRSLIASANAMLSNARSVS